MSIYKLGDIIDITSSKRIYRSEYVDDGVPFYRSKEIIEHYNYKPVSTELYITENKYEEIKSKFGVPEKGDMLITSVGSLGIPYLVSGDFDFYFKDGNLIWFRNFSEVIDSKFFYLWVQSHDGKSRFKQSQIGTSQPAYTIANIKKIEITLPPLPIQKRIADILSAYDDLIENNNRRIALLEQAARHLYKEWFVRLKFPGHEKVKVVDGVPEGWERKTLGEVCEYNIGGGWGKDEYTGTYNTPGYVIRGTDFSNIKNGDFNIPFRYHLESNLKSRVLTDNDLILEVSNGNLNKVGDIFLVLPGLVDKFDEKVMCASFCKLLRLKSKELAPLVYMNIKELNATGNMLVYKNPSAAGINNFFFFFFQKFPKQAFPFIAT